MRGVYLNGGIRDNPDDIDALHNGWEGIKGEISVDDTARMKRVTRKRSTDRCLSRKQEPLVREG